MDDQTTVRQLIESAGIGEPFAMSIPQFCQRIGISLRSYYAMPPDERPPETCFGRRKVIRTETGKEWLRQREQRSAM